MDQENELFKFISVPMQEDMETYIEAASEQVENQKEYFTGPPANDVFSFSPLPWISYTHISHTIFCSGATFLCGWNSCWKIHRKAAEFFK